MAFPLDETTQSEGNDKFIAFQANSWVWTRETHILKTPITDLYESSVSKLRERHHFMHLITPVVYLSRFGFVTTVLLKILLYRDVPGVATDQWRILIRQSVLAERYNDAFCTFPLILISGSGFATATGDIPQHSNFMWLTLLPQDIILTERAMQIWSVTFKEKYQIPKHSQHNTKISKFYLKKSQKIFKVRHKNVCYFF